MARSRIRRIGESARRRVRDDKPQPAGEECDAQAKRRPEHAAERRARDLHPEQRQARHAMHTLHYSCRIAIFLIYTSQRDAI